MSLRIETIHGRHLVCGSILSKSAVKHGQTWAPADGTNHTVYIESAGDSVEYSWVENGLKKASTKQNFAFQCRYCLVVDTPEVPEEFTKSY